MWRSFRHERTFSGQPPACGDRAPSLLFGLPAELLGEPVGGSEHVGHPPGDLPVRFGLHGGVSAACLVALLEDLLEVPFELLDAMGQLRDEGLDLFGVEALEDLGELGVEDLVLRPPEERRLDGHACLLSRGRDALVLASRVG